MMSLDEILNVLFERLKTISKSETVIGEPMRLGEIHVVPISRLRIGFMLGTRKDATGATGGGISVEPVALLAISPEGKANLLPISKGAISVVDRVVEMVPEVIEKILPKERKEEERKEEER